ncbi:hypothetical protein GGI07_002703 [Coemansia sp. Benny D115]|nr:hypothetical protein GGI07_002703 [Coemansia sp. Benny D115]
MTRVAKPAPKKPESGTQQFVSKPLMLKKSEIEQQKKDEARGKRKATDSTQTAAEPKRARSENAKKKRSEQRRLQRQTEKEKNTTCFLCRTKGHSIRNCPTTTATGICYHCGSLEHTTKMCPKPGKTFPYATCFVCQQQGHLASLCPKNEKGLYPNGGGCKYCGSTQHLAKDCAPTRVDRDEVVVGLVEDGQGGDDDMVFSALRMQQKDRIKEEAEKAAKGPKKPKRVVARF